ncbi:MAG: CRTAC1 family protein [Myxococcota bacterium]|nr:CRTAC1 family protein [Myxococcota bacterium]
MQRVVPGLFFLVSGCVAPPPTESPLPDKSASLEASWEIGEEVPCSAGQDAFLVLEEQGEQHGVDRPIPESSSSVTPGHYLVGVLVADLEADEDLDLAFNRPDGGIDLYLNDGSGNFTHSDALATEGMSWGPSDLSRGFADINGDGLPELFQTSFDGLSMRPALAPLEWGPRQSVWDATGTPYEGAGWLSFSVGDLDGDGPLDLVLASLHGAFDHSAGQGGPPAEAELIFFGDGTGGFSEPVRLVSHEGPGMSQLILLTDRDADGDLDIFVGSDLVGPQWPPGTLFENGGLGQDGTLQLADVGEESGGAVAMSHMGADASDLNGDGLLDYCFTDIGPVVCLESDPSGVFVDTRAVHGLVPASMDIPEHWTGWSMEIADLDNDGLEDFVAAAGRVDDFVDQDNPGDLRPWESDQPNGIWQATARGVWEERTDLLDFGSIRESYGLATADLDGDGALEVIIGNELGLPSVWWNQCSDGAWLQIDIQGRAHNVDALGAAVVIEDGEERWTQEVYSLRTLGQGPTRLHFGLGDRETVERVTVRWPGGATSVRTDLPTRRFLRVRHPEAF